MSVLVGASFLMVKRGTRELMSHVHLGWANFVPNPELAFGVSLVGGHFFLLMSHVHLGWVNSIPNPVLAFGVFFFRGSS